MRFCPALFAIALLMSFNVDAQVLETVDLRVIASQHYSETSGEALGVWSELDTHSDEVLAHTASIGSEYDESGAMGSYNIQATSETVNGAIDTMILGLNTTASVISQLQSAMGGWAGASTNGVIGNAIAEVMPPSQTGRLIARCELQTFGMRDSGTGISTTNWIMRDGEVMGQVWSDGEFYMGMLTRIEDPRVAGSPEIPDFVFGSVGESVHFSFYVGPGTLLESGHWLNLAAGVYSGPFSQQSSAGFASTLEYAEVVVLP